MTALASGTVEAHRHLFGVIVAEFVEFVAHTNGLDTVEIFRHLGSNVEHFATTGIAHEADGWTVSHARRFIQVGSDLRAVIAAVSAGNAAVTPYRNEFNKYTT